MARLQYDALVEPILPIDSGAGWGASCPAVLVERGILYQGKAEPVAPPTAAFPDLAWQPTYPDRLPAPVLPRSWITLATAPTAVPDLAWGPTLPDQVIRPMAQPLGPAIVEGRFPVTDAAPTLAWAPSYPDAIVRLTLPTAQQLAWVLGQTVTVAPAPDGTARSYHPDWIARATLPIADYPFFWTGREPSLTDAAPVLSWHPTYPDYLFPAPWLRALFHVPSQVLVIPAPAVPPFAIYPDWIARAVLPVAAMPAQNVGWPTPSPFPIPDLAWAPTMPATIDWPRLPTAAQLATARRVDDIPAAPTTSWYPTYPDRATRTVLPISSHLFFVFRPGPVPALERRDFTPSYPDWLPHPALLVADMPALAFPGTPIVAPDRSWAPSYPDWLPRRFPTPSPWPEMTGASAIVVIAQSLAWRGERPDLVWRARSILPHLGGFFEEIPNVVIADVYTCIELTDVETNGSTLIAAQTTFSTLIEETVDGSDATIPTIC